MTVTPHQNAALAAFVECVVAKLSPTLNAHTHPRNGDAEYEILIGGGGGVIHEAIEEVLAIAKRNGGRAFVAPDDAEDLRHGRLCIVWPGRQPDGPDPQGEHDAQVAKGRRAPRSAKQREASA